MEREEGRTMNASVVTLPATAAASISPWAQQENPNKLGKEHDAFGEFRKQAFSSPTFSMGSTNEKLGEVHQLVAEGKVRRAVFDDIIEQLSVSRPQSQSNIEDVLRKPKKTRGVSISKMRSGVMFRKKKGERQPSGMWRRVVRVKVQVGAQFANIAPQRRSFIRPFSRTVRESDVPTTVETPEVSQYSAPSEWGDETAELSEVLNVLSCDSDKVISKMRWKRMHCEMLSNSISIGTPNKAQMTRFQNATTLDRRRKGSHLRSIFAKSRNLDFNPDVFVVAGFFRGFVRGELPALRRPSAGGLSGMADFPSAGYTFSVFTDASTTVFSCHDKVTRDTWVEALTNRLELIRNQHWELDHPVHSLDDLKPERKAALAVKRQRAYESSKAGHSSLHESEAVDESGTTTSEFVEVDMNKSHAGI